MSPIRALLAGAAVLGLAVPAAAQDLNAPPVPPAERYRLRLEYREYRPELTGKARKGTTTSEGSLIDVLDDLGLEDDRTFEGRGIFQLKQGHKLRGSYTPLEYRGDHEVPNTFTYGDTRYERFTRVRSSIKGYYAGADYEWDFIQRQGGFLGVVLGARGFDVDTVVLDVSDNVREADTIRVVVPVLGLTTRLYTGRLSFEAEATGLSVGDKGHMIEVDGGVRYHISDRLAVGIGYRYLDLEGKDGRDEVKLKLGGWQGGIELSL